ncbi:MAG: HDOD domain-containing protein [Sandaracinaceae bacterium]
MGWFGFGRARDPKKELEAVLGRYELPSFPAVASDVLRRLRDPDGELSAAADRLAEDPGLTQRVLGLANASAYALRHPVRSVAHAVSLLGRSEVESLVLAVVVRHSLPNPTGPGFDGARFWRSAARRAAAARAVADRVAPAGRSDSFTAALLSDMAVPLLCAARGEAYGEVLQQWHAAGGDLASLERDALGWDHPTVAGWMARRWRFPERLTDAIAVHHESADDEGLLPAVGLVAPLGEAEGAGVEQVVEEVAGRYGLPRDEIVALLAEAETQAGEIAARMA